MKVSIYEDYRCIYILVCVKTIIKTTALEIRIGKLMLTVLSLKTCCESGSTRMYMDKTLSQ